MRLAHEHPSLAIPSHNYAILLEQGQGKRDPDYIVKKQCFLNIVVPDSEVFFSYKVLCRTQIC